jgi:VanZ family protein
MWTLSGPQARQTRHEWPSLKEMERSGEKMKTDHSMETAKRRGGVWIVLLWPLLIFVTSCFYIDSATFIRLMQQLSDSPAYREGFARFWNGYGLLVVKGWHATEYAILVVVGAAMLRRWQRGRAGKAIQSAFAFAILYAATDEWHQTFVPGRHGSLRDVLIDSMGALLAAVCLSAWERRKHRRRRDRDEDCIDRGRVSVADRAARSGGTTGPCGVSPHPEP